MAGPPASCCGGKEEKELRNVLLVVPVVLGRITGKKKRWGGLYIR